MGSFVRDFVRLENLESIESGKKSSCQVRPQVGMARAYCTPSTIQS